MRSSNSWCITAEFSTGYASLLGRTLSVQPGSRFLLQYVFVRKSDKTCGNKVLKLHALSPQTFNSGPSAPAKAPRSRRRKFLRALTWLLLLPFFLVLLTLLLVYLPPVQNTLRGKAVSFLEAKTGTTVRLDHFNLRFPLGVTLEGLFVADEHGDTLLHAGTLKAQVGLRALFNKRILLTSVELPTFAQWWCNSPTAASTSTSSSRGSPRRTGHRRKHPPIPAAVSISRWKASSSMRSSSIWTCSRAASQWMCSSASWRWPSISSNWIPCVFMWMIWCLRTHRYTYAPPAAIPLLRPTRRSVNPLELDVRFNAIELNDVSFTMKTVDSGDSLWLAMENADITSRDMDLTQQRLALEELDVDGVRFGMIAAQSAAAPSTAQSDPPWLDQRDGFRYWLRDWTLPCTDCASRRAPSRCTRTGLFHWLRCSTGAPGLHGHRNGRRRPRAEQRAGGDGTTEPAHARRSDERPIGACHVVGRHAGTSEHQERYSKGPEVELAFQGDLLPVILQRPIARRMMCPFPPKCGPHCA